MCVLGIEPKQVSKKESTGAGNWLDLKNEAARIITNDPNPGNVKAVKRQ